MDLVLQTLLFMHVIFIFENLTYEIGFTLIIYMDFVFLFTQKNKIDNRLSYLLVETKYVSNYDLYFLNYDKYLAGDKVGEHVLSIRQLTFFQHSICTIFYLFKFSVSYSLPRHSQLQFLNFMKLVELFMTVSGTCFYSVITSTL